MMTKTKPHQCHICMDELGYHKMGCPRRDNPPRRGDLFSGRGIPSVQRQGLLGVVQVHYVNGVRLAQVPQL